MKNDEEYGNRDTFRISGYYEASELGIPRSAGFG
jgi:hypothetical protein